MKPFRFRAVVTLLLFYASSGQAQRNWYKAYRGAIGKDPVMINLCKTGHDYFGYYYFDLYEEPVYFTGEDTSEHGNIRLTSFLANPEMAESFIFSMKGGTISGEWHNTDKNKTLNFSAEENLRSLSFDLKYARGSIKLRPKLTGYPEATYEAASVWPKGNSPQSLFIKKLINQLFGQINATEDIGKMFNRKKEEFLDGYVANNRDLKDEEISGSFAYNLDQKDHLMIVFQSARLLTLAEVSYSYTGGAHGNYGTSFTSLDLPGSKKIELDDVVTVAGQKQLPGLLEKYFRKSYALNETDSLTEAGLFENKIEPNSNFYVTEKGIGFNYVPYEIGPFSMGELNIFIPFAELQKYLQPAFKNLIG